MDGRIAFEASVAYYYNMVPDGIILWSFFFSVPLRKTSFTSFIFQTRIAVSHLLGLYLACYLILHKSLTVSAFLLSTCFRIPIASRDEAASALDFNKLERDPQSYPVDVDTTRTKRLIYLRNTNLDEKKK